MYSWLVVAMGYKLLPGLAQQSRWAVAAEPTSSGGPLERPVAKYLHDKESERHSGDAQCLAWPERHSWMELLEKRRL